MIIVTIVCLSLLAVSGLLIDYHRRSWHSTRADASLSASQQKFAQKQFRRRMVSSGLIGTAGVAIGLEPVIPRSPFPMAVYLAILLIICVTIITLAMADAWATRLFYYSLRNQNPTAQQKLAKGLEELQEKQQAFASEANMPSSEPKPKDGP